MTTPRRLRPAPTSASPARGRRTASAGAADLRLALALTDSLQTVIRAGDGKVASLAALVCGAVALVSDRAPEAPAIGLALVAATVLCAGGAARHLLAAVTPRLTGGATDAAAGFLPYDIVSRALTDAHGDRSREQAWSHAAVLVAIAVRKHTAIRRSLPWVAAEMIAATGALAATLLS
ncbi:hypothetical protein [Actinoplanes sp. RD1]|uniref:hypothetical protein n=1 Tax=Actinoplanes sp. RD1 TaxID=3064538 RepID=UPI0027411AB7|nr:hypothetical protein [Actinoplanes sp. RD1]